MLSLKCGDTEGSVPDASANYAPTEARLAAVVLLPAWQRQRAASLAWPTHRAVRGSH